MAGPFTDFMRPLAGPTQPPAPAPVIPPMPAVNPSLGTNDPILRLVLTHMEQQQKLAKARQRYEAGRRAARMILGQ